jgi:PAS domain S-box-containing protein
VWWVGVEGKPRWVRMRSKQLGAELQQALTASGCGTFTVRRDGEATWDGYPHPLTRKAGHFSGTISELLERAQGAERERVVRAFETLFAGGGPLYIKVAVDDRRISFRGGIRSVDGAPAISGICADVTEEESPVIQETHRRRVEGHSDVLFGLTRRVAEIGQDFGRAVRLITETVAATLDVERAGIWLYEAQRGVTTCVDLYEFGPARHSGGHEIENRHTARYIAAIEGARMLCADDAQNDPRLGELAEPYIKPLGITSMLDAPVRLGGRLCAFVCCEHVGPPRVWSAEEVSFAASTADLVALVLEGNRRAVAEHALDRQSTFLRQVIDLNPNLIFAKDREGRFTLVNQSLADVYGTTVDGLVGKTDADFNKNAEEVEWFRKKDLEVMNRGQEVIIAEEVITDAQGRQRFLQTVKRPIVDADGHAHQILGVATDITERKRAEEDRQKLEVTLRHAQRMESVGILAGGMAHDFNNLLTPILAYAEQAMKELPAGHPVIEDLGEIASAAKQARDITAQLMAFGRKQVLKVRAIDLNEEVIAGRRMLSRFIPTNIEVAVKLAPDLPAILADPTQIQQIIINLAANARDAMPNGGTLTIVTGTGLDDRVELAVIDTGTGIDPAALPHIFEPFFTTKELGRGTGLGLATVYGIVNQHGGTIDVESEPGRGTIFTILLPRAQGRPASSAPASVAVPSRGDETVLVVEDEKLVRKMIKKMLTLAGFNVLVVSDPLEALELARTHVGAIHLLLTDVVMPHMNGKELFDRMAAIRPGTKVVFMSGHARDYLGRQGVLADGISFVAKPFVPAELTRVVRETLDKNPR